jgi:hypothetical protein
VRSRLNLGELDSVSEQAPGSGRLALAVELDVEIAVTG